MTGRLTSAALNVFGSIANSLTEGDDTNFVVQQDERVGSASCGSDGALETLELQPMNADDHTEAAKWRRQCLAQRQILRAELLQALEKMDQQLATLGVDVDESKIA